MQRITHRFINRQLYYWIIIFSILVIVPAVSFGGEWCGTTLEREIEMYENVVKLYKEAQDGTPIESFGLRIDDGGAGFDAPRCWSVENRIKLAALLKKMISDERLHKKTVANAIMHYIRIQEFDKKFAVTSLTKEISLKHSIDIQKSLLKSYIKIQVFDEFILNYLNSSEQEIKKIMLEHINAKPYALNSIDNDLLKRSVKQIEDDKLKQNILMAIANNESFDNFIIFCQQNNLDIPDYIIKTFNNFEAVEFIINRYSKQKINYKNNDKNKDYFKHSGFILSVLAGNLHQLFPVRYLERMTSEDLRFLRNGIYATYGKNFKSKVLLYFFYGSFANITRFCRNGNCGTRDTRNRKYKDSDLTAIDKTNIANILSVETIRKEAGYKENYLVENYDLQAFIKGEADNYTLTSPKLREIYQVKLDWIHKHVWLWDKFGVSGWDLQTSKRFHFAKGALGPIGLASNKGLVAYQHNGQLIVKNINNNNTCFTEPVSESEKRCPNQSLNIFSPDEKYFVYCSKSTVNVLDTEYWESKSAQLGRLRIWDSELDNYKFYIRPYDFTTNGKHLLLFTTQDRNLGLAVIPLAEPNKSKLLNYPYRKSGPGQILAMALDDRGDYLYIDEGFQTDILGYKVKNILNDNSLKVAARKLNPGKEDYRYVKNLFVHKGKLIRVQSRGFGYLDLSSNRRNTETKPIDRGVPDFYFPEKIYATGLREGYVVVRRLPF